MYRGLPVPKKKPLPEHVRVQGTACTQKNSVPEQVQAVWLYHKIYYWKRYSLQAIQVSSPQLFFEGGCTMYLGVPGRVGGGELSTL